MPRDMPADFPTLLLLLSRVLLPYFADAAAIIRYALRYAVAACFCRHAAADDMPRLLPFATPPPLFDYAPCLIRHTRYDIVCAVIAAIAAIFAASFRYFV